MEMTIIGCSRHAGRLDDGKEYAFVKLHVLAPLKNDPDRRGSSSVELRGDLALWDNIERLNYPITAELHMTMEADGKGGFRQVVTGVQPNQKRTAAAA